MALVKEARNMRVKTGYDLILVIILSVIFFLVAAFLPSSVLRIVFSIPFIFFFSGYTLVALLFPKKDSLSIIERVVLSIALSIAIVTIIGLGLSFTPWGIDIYPISITINIIIVVFSSLAYYRRYKTRP